VSPFEYFASGTNEPGQIWGFARIGHPLGVAADQCLERTGCEVALLEVAQAFPEQRVFIDSGAFSEVEFIFGQGLVPVHPISDAEWRLRLGLMQSIADAYGDRALLIAPDQVGDQQSTLERLARYREQVLALAATGAEVAIVLQGGDMDLAAFEDEAARVLGWDGFIRAFPMKKGATQGKVLRHYLERRQPSRVHLLGVGPQYKGDKKAGRYSAKQLLAMFAEVAPDVAVSWDSALIPAKVGRDKPGGRPLTRAQDIQAHELVAEALTSSGTRDPFREVEYDWTEVEPYDYLGPVWGAEAVRSARAAGTAGPIKKAEKAYRKRALETAKRASLTGDEAEAFIRDPNAFVHAQDAEGVERWEWDVPLANELEEEFAVWVLEGSAQLRKERSIVGAFAPDQPDWEGPPLRLFAPAIHPKSHRVVRGEIHELEVVEEPDELLRRHQRPHEPQAGEQLSLLNNPRYQALKRKLMQ
jgi:hypothetical protein